MSVAHTQIPSKQVEDEINVHLPGFRNIIDKKQHFCVRMFWIFAVFTSLVACGFQILERMNHFKKSKISVALSIDVDAQLPLPTIVVCPTLIRRLIEKCDTKKAEFCSKLTVGDLEVFFNEMKETKVTTKLKDEFKTIIDFYRIDFFESIYGTCIVFNYKKALNTTPAALAEIYFANMNRMKSFLFNNGPVSFSVSIHENGLINDYDLLHGKKIDFIEGFSQFSVSVRKQLQLNLPLNPCGATVDFYKCRRKCVDKIRKIVKCRLPFTNETIEIEKCSVQSIYKSIKEIDQLLVDFDWSQCDCIKPCESITFESTFHSLALTNTQWTFPDYYYFININFKDTHLQTIRQYQEYTRMAFICDIGGTLSLFLGFCLLSALEVIDEMFFKKKKKDNLTAIKFIVKNHR